MFYTPSLLPGGLLGERASDARCATRLLMMHGVPTTTTADDMTWHGMTYVDCVPVVSSVWWLQAARMLYTVLVVYAVYRTPLLGGDS